MILGICFVLLPLLPRLILLIALNTFMHLMQRSKVKERTTLGASGLLSLPDWHLLNHSLLTLWN